MVDQFDIRREEDRAAEEMVEHAMGLVEESQEKAQERLKRLIPLGDEHYFDPQERVILLKVGKNFRYLGHDRVYMELAAEKVEEQARAQGFVPVAGGLFWNPTTKHLYVNHDGRYVLYSLDRRGPTGG